MHARKHLTPTTRSGWQEVLSCLIGQSFHKYSLRTPSVPCAGGLKAYSVFLLRTLHDSEDKTLRDQKVCAPCHNLPTFMSTLVDTCPPCFLIDTCPPCSPQAVLHSALSVSMAPTQLKKVLIMLWAFLFLSCDLTVQISGLNFVDDHFWLLGIPAGVVTRGSFVFEPFQNKINWDPQNYFTPCLPQYYFKRLSRPRN